MSIKDKNLWKVGISEYLRGVYCIMCEINVFFIALMWNIDIIISTNLLFLKIKWSFKTNLPISIANI